MNSGDLVASRYRLHARLGAGGFGEVWRSHDETLGRPVALKLIHESLEDETARARFLEEARITASLAHPHVVSVLDFGLLDGDRPFLVYELVEGGSLQAPGPVTPGRLQAWGTQLAEALGAAHDAGILHRDLKPENVLLRGASEAVLCDFGIARRDASGTRLTAEGLILGTPAFMAPELWLGRPASPASDQFAWAATLVRIAGGGSVYGTDEVSAIAEAGRGAAPLKIAELPQLPSQARDVLVQALAAAPEERFASIRAAGRAWGRALATTGSGPLARPDHEAMAQADRQVQTAAIPAPSRQPAEGHGPTTRITRPRRRRRLVLAAVIALGVGIGGMMMRPSTPASAPRVDSMAEARAALARLIGPLDPVRHGELDDLPQEALAWLASPRFEGEFLAAADAVEALLTSADQHLAPEDETWVIHGAIEELCDTLDLLRRVADDQVPVPPHGDTRRPRPDTLRKALELRLARRAGDTASPARARQVTFWSALLLRTGGSPGLESTRAAVDALRAEELPMVRLWMRYRLLESVQEARGATCEGRLRLLLVLARDRPTPPPPRGARPEMSLLAWAVHRQISQGFNRNIQACPGEARPGHWQILDASLAALDRNLIRSRELTELLRAHYSLMRDRGSSFDALGDHRAVVTPLLRRIQIRMEEAAALVDAELPDWIRRMPRDLEDLDRYLGPDARLPFSEGRAVGGSKELEPREAARRFDHWLDQCQRAFRSTTDQLPGAAWPWLTRNLLPAPSRILQAMRARVARLRDEEDLLPEQQAAWDAVVERLHAEASKEGLGSAYGDNRLPLLGQWLLAQTGESIGPGDYAVAISAAELEVDDHLRAWMYLTLMDTIREVGEDDCAEVRTLPVVGGSGTWRKDPAHMAEGFRRILIDGSTLAARCWNELPDGYWELLREALEYHESSLTRDPAWVERAAERALEGPRLMLIGDLAPREVADFLNAVEGLRGEAAGLHVGGNLRREVGH